MSGTKDCKQELKEELNSVLGNYIPNKIDLENLTTYLYKTMLNTMKDANVEEELKRVGSVTDNDRAGFNRALHTIALSASQNIIFQTLKETYGSLKHKVDLVTVNSQHSNGGMYVPSPNIPRPDNRMTSVEGEFDIDLSAVGKVDSESKEELRRKALEDIEKSREVAAQYMQRNSSSIPDEQEFEMSNEFLSEVNMNTGSSSVSKYDTDEVFDFIPKMSFDMDY